MRFDTPFQVWRRAAGVAAARPVLFVMVSLLLAGTDLMLWRIGVYDSPAEAAANRGAMAAFVVAKLIVLLGWSLAGLRLATTPRMPILTALSISRRQAMWIGGALLMLPLLMGLRIVLTKLVGAALAPLAPDPRGVLVGGVLLYLVVSLTLLARLLPGWAGVMIGDREAGLVWSWRNSRGRVLTSIGLVVGSVLPLAAIHFGNNLFWLSAQPALRAATLAADGLVMALFALVTTASYVALYRGAKARSEAEESASAAAAIAAAPAR